MNKPKVSVIIPTLNRAECLTDTINDLLNQTYQNFEIVIVDQSPQKDEKALTTLKNRTQKKISAKYFLVSFKGLPRARNFGWLKADGELLIYIDDDVKIPANFIQQHIDAHKQDGVQVVAGGIDEARRKDNPNPTRTGKYNFWNLTPYRDFNSNRPQYVDHAPGGNFSVKRPALESVFGFDESLGAGAGLFEESDFCLRIKKKKGKIFFDPKARLQHLAHPTGGCRVDQVPEYLWTLTRNGTILMVRHLNFYHMPTGTIRLLLYIYSYFRQNRSAKTIWRGLVGIIDGLISSRMPHQAPYFAGSLTVMFESF
jgi:GT2 family glycosyltransferase